MKHLGLLAALVAAFSFGAQAQIFGGSTQAGRVTNSACSNGQVPTYDANKRLSGCSSAGSGSLQLLLNGTSVGTRPALNLLDALGIAWTITDDPGNNRINAAATPDTSILLTRATAQAGTPWYCRSTSGNDTYACTTNPAQSSSSLARGQFVLLDADTANTGTATLAIGGGTAVSILKRDGSSLSDGDIAANRGVLLYYNGTNFSVVGDGGGTATSPLFSTFTIPNDSGATDYNTALTRSVIDGYPVFTSSITGGASQGRLISEGSTFDRKFSMFLEFGAGGDGHAGIMMADASNRAFVCGYRYNNALSVGIAGLEFFAYNMSGVNTYTAAVSAASPMTNFQYRGRTLLSPLYMRAIRDATNLKCQTSPNGVIWIDFAVQTVSAFTTAVGGTGPTLTGIWIREGGTAASTRLYWTGYQ